MSDKAKGTLPVRIPDAGKSALGVHFAFPDIPEPAPGSPRSFPDVRRELPNVSQLDSGRPERSAGSWILISRRRGRGAERSARFSWSRGRSKGRHLSTVHEGNTGFSRQSRDKGAS
jgi:hypothetical protein